MAGLPLDDIRVIDLTIARAGPNCVRQLADWGADVIRVDAPPGIASADAGDERHRGSDYQNLHRNKRSLCLNLKAPEGREVLLRLVATADVLVENMRPPVKHRLGVDYEALHARNPRLVYASLSGFGQRGPYADRGGFDQIAQGMGGLMGVTGQPEGPPTRAGTAISDLSAGLFMALGILVALHERERTGQGRWVQTSLLEAMIAMMDFQAVRWTVDGAVPASEGNHHPTNVPMGCFESADGYVNVAAHAGRMLQRFCDVIGVPDLPSDPRFDSGRKRSANRTELNQLISERLRTRTTAEWVRVLNDAGVPCGPVYKMDEVFADPQVADLQMVQTARHPELGELRLLRHPVSMNDGPATVRTATPDAGENSEEILIELGLTPAEIADLRKRSII